MKTKALYLDDSYAQEMEATILDVIEEGPGRYGLILDQTVFYPMGGGQPTDQGKLESGSWSGDVYQVMMKDGEIYHSVNAKSVPTMGMKVKGAINWDRRYKNMRVHSAGHVVDFAMHVLGYSPTTLVPMQGDHGKKPLIVYQGTLDHDIKQELQDKANELVKKNLKITWEYADLETLKKDAIYLQPGLPTNKPLRKITLEGVGSVADGGTQVKETGEVGEIEILAVDSDGVNMTVSYGVK